MLCHYFLEHFPGDLANCVTDVIKFTVCQFNGFTIQFGSLGLLLWPFSFRTAQPFQLCRCHIWVRTFYHVFCPLSLWSSLRLFPPTLWCHQLLVLLLLFWQPWSTLQRPSLPHGKPLPRRPTSRCTFAVPIAWWHPFVFISMSHRVLPDPGHATRVAMSRA